MSYGSGESDEQFSVEIKIDPTIIQAIEVLGTGSTRQVKLTNLLKAVLTTRLLDLEARALKLQATYLKKLEKKQISGARVTKREQDLKLQVPKGPIETQRHLQALQQLLASDVSPHSKDTGAEHGKSEISINVFQFIAIQALGEIKNPKLNLDLVGLLIEEVNARLNQLNATLARELMGQETISGASAGSSEPKSKDILKDANPALVQRKELLALLGNLEEIRERLVAQERRLKLIRERIEPFAIICASVLPVNPEEIITATEELFQKEATTPDILSYEVLDDLFRGHVKNFNELARDVSLKERPTSKKPPKSSPAKALKQPTKPRSNRQNESSSQVPERSNRKNEDRIQAPDFSPPSHLSDEIILEHLSSEPMDIRDLLTKMSIENMADARVLQIQLRKLEYQAKLCVKIHQGKKLYYKKTKE